MEPEEGAGGGGGLPEGSLGLFRYVLVATGGAFFNRAMPTPFLPLVLRQEFGLPMAEVGLVLAAYPLGALVATSWSCGVARAAARLFRLHSLAILAMAAAALLYPLLSALLAAGALPSDPASVALAVALLRAAQGVSQALYLAANTSLITRSFHEAVPYVVGMAEVAVGLGSQCGRLIGGPLYDAGGFACPFLFTAGLQIVVACGAFAVKDHASSIAPPSGETLHSKTHDLAWSTLLTLRVGAALGAVCTCYFMTGLFDATLPQHLEDYLGPLSVSAVALVSSSRSVVYLTSSYICAKLLQRNLVRLEFLITLGGASVFMSLITAAPQSFLPAVVPSVFHTSIGRWLVQMLSIVASSSGQAMLFVPSLPLMQREVHHLGRHAEEQVAMIFMGGMSMGEAFGPIVGGALVGAYGFRATTAAFAALILGLLASALLIFGTPADRSCDGDPAEAAADTLGAPLFGGPPAAPSMPVGAFCLATDGEGAYAYRRIPFALREARGCPGSAPSASFRRQYSQPAREVPKSATLPASTRRPFRPTPPGQPGHAAEPGGQEPRAPAARASWTPRAGAPRSQAKA